MFLGYKADTEKYSPPVEIFQMLRDAGCDIKNERDLQMGMVSYNTALLVWNRLNANKKTGRSTEKSHTGRNDPCPCGSGRKYKKCCLDKNRAFSADSSLLAPAKLGPESLPRLWNERAMADDCGVLVQIMGRDPAFAKVGFSKESVASFMETVAKEDPSFVGDDKEMLDERIDDLAIRYVRESGESIKGIKEIFLAAVPRAQSKDETRALATGICVALMGDACMDPEANLLNVIFFRRALCDVIESAALIDKVLDQLGGDTEELRRLIAENDPCVREKIESCVEALTASDMETLQGSFEKSREELWDTISSGEFPVPMPFATQLALLFRFASLARDDEESSPEAFYGILEAFSNELIDEDHILYGQMLDRWLKDCKERSGKVAKAVEVMAVFCAIQSIEEFVPSLLVRSGQQGLFIPFDEEEQPFIDGCGSSYDDPQFLANYGAWLASKGYLGMAKRLVASRESHASSESPGSRAAA
jgi:SEC-C motif